MNPPPRMIAPPVREQNKRFFYVDSAGEERGPVSFVELATLVQEEILGPNSEVWREGDADWKKAKDFFDDYIPKEHMVMTGSFSEMKKSYKEAGKQTSKKQMPNISDGCFGIICLLWVIFCVIVVIGMLKTCTSADATDHDKFRAVKTVILLIMFGSGTFWGLVRVGASVTGVEKRSKKQLPHTKTDKPQTARHTPKNPNAAASFGDYVSSLSFNSNDSVENKSYSEFDYTSPCKEQTIPQPVSPSEQKPKE